MTPTGTCRRSPTSAVRPGRCRHLPPRGTRRAVLPGCPHRPPAGRHRTARHAHTASPGPPPGSHGAAVPSRSPHAARRRRRSGCPSGNPRGPARAAVEVADAHRARPTPARTPGGVRRWPRAGPGTSRSGRTRPVPRSCPDRSGAAGPGSWRAGRPGAPGCRRTRRGEGSGARSSRRARTRRSPTVGSRRLPTGHRGRRWKPRPPAVRAPRPPRRHATRSPRRHRAGPRRLPDRLVAGSVAHRCRRHSRHGTTTSDGMLHPTASSDRAPRCIRRAEPRRAPVPAPRPTAVSSCPEWAPDAPVFVIGSPLPAAGRRDPTYPTGDRTSRPRAGQIRTDPARSIRTLRSPSVGCTGEATGSVIVDTPSSSRG